MKTLGVFSMLAIVSAFAAGAPAYSTRIRSLRGLLLSIPDTAPTL